MRCLALCVVAVLGAASTHAQTGKPQISVTSAANYVQAIAPSSLATIFGSGLSGTTVTAELGSDGHLPTQLAGVSVEVNQQIAPLIFVSPTQINFVVPDNIATGSAAVVVHSAS